MLNTNLNEIWIDPVWSKVIAAMIIFISSQILVFILGGVKKIGFFEVYRRAYNNSKSKINKWVEKKNRKKAEPSIETSDSLEISEAPTVFFHYRCCDAFPGIDRGYQWLTKSKDINTRDRKSVV